MRARDDPKGVMHMIEFDESEFLYTDVTDITLKFIFDMYGPEVRDMLLVPKVVTDVRFPDFSLRSDI